MLMWIDPQKLETRDAQFLRFFTEASYCYYDALPNKETSTPLRYCIPLDTSTADPYISSKTHSSPFCLCCCSTVPQGTRRHLVEAKPALGEPIPESTFQNQLPTIVCVAVSRAYPRQDFFSIFFATFLLITKGVLSIT